MICCSDVTISQHKHVVECGQVVSRQVQCSDSNFLLNTQSHMGATCVAGFFPLVNSPCSASSAVGQISYGKGGWLTLFVTCFGNLRRKQCKFTHQPTNLTGTCTRNAGTADSCVPGLENSANPKAEQGHTREINHRSTSI